MPNRATHAQVGAAAGGICAALRVAGAPTTHQLAETIGGLIGGWVGGVLPDVLEPATTPNHRQAAHSVVAGGTLMLARLAEWQAGCRAAADGAARRALLLPLRSDERRRAETEALVWRFVAGALVGLVAGYASHLLLDATTARGLPFLVR